MVRLCEYCGGSGFRRIDRALEYRCPDCDGTHYLADCRECGITVPAVDLDENELCGECAAQKEAEQELAEQEAVNG